MTRRHQGARLGIAAFAARADNIASSTLEAYIARGQPKSNPVPPPCGIDDVSGQRWWCEKHADLWINNRPRKQKEQQ